MFFSLDKLGKIQKALEDEALDGWLLYDFRGSNEIAEQILGLDAECRLTRRFFYWIPSNGDPVKIVTAIDQFSQVLERTGGTTTLVDYDAN